MVFGRLSKTHVTFLLILSLFCTTINFWVILITYIAQAGWASKIKYYHFFSNILLLNLLLFALEY